MNREYGMRAGRIHIQVVVTCSALLLSFEKTVERLLFVANLSQSLATNRDLAHGILLDSHARASLLSRRGLRKHVEHQFIVDLDKRNFDRDLVIETAANLREDLVDSAWNQSSVLVVGSGATHGEGFASTGLTVAENGAVEAIDDFVDGLLSTVLKDLFLGSVMHDLVEFECPLLLLVVYHAGALVFCHCNSDSLRDVTACLDGASNV